MRTYFIGEEKYYNYVYNYTARSSATLSTNYLGRFSDALDLSMTNYVITLLDLLI